MENDSHNTVIASGRRWRKGMGRELLLIGLAGIVLGSHPEPGPAAEPVDIRFSEQTTPEPQFAGLLTAIPEGWRVSAIRFRFRANARPPSALLLNLHSATGERIWSLALEPPPVGEWGEYEKTVGFDTGWTCGPTASSEQFENDLATLKSVELTVLRNAAGAEHTFTVDALEVTTFAVDSDSDLIPDYWEARFHLDAGNATDAGEDADQDGRSNYEEYIADTDPNEKTSSLRMTGIRVSDATVAIDWEGGSEAVQIVEKRAPEATDWEAVKTLNPPTPQTNTVTDGAAQKGLYRIRAVRP